MPATAKHPSRLRGAWRPARAEDGTEISWRADGPGAPGGAARSAVVLCNGIACSDDYWGGLVGPLAVERPVVRWDYRGHHRSGPPADPRLIGPATLAADLLAVLDAAALDHVVLVGHSYGVQVALHASGALGPRLTGLVAVAGATGRALHGIGVPVPATVALPVARGVAALAPGAARTLWRRLWTSAAPYWLARGIGGTSRAAPRYVLDDFQRHVAALDPITLGAMMHAMAVDDAGPALDGLDVPVLAVAGRRDRITPVGRLREIAARAPRGALAIHPRAAHTLPAEEPAWLLERLRPVLTAADRRAGATD